MPHLMFKKIKRHLENNQKSANQSLVIEQLMKDLPQNLRAAVISCTHGEIIQKIDYFKDKESEFLYKVMPELKPMRIMQGDVLY
jgi:hypothetical protein